MREELRKFKGFTMKNMPEYEGFAPGHRGCQGCGTVLPLRLTLKALGPDTIVVNATGCMEIISTPFPFTSWKVPWIHVAFENTASVASSCSNFSIISLNELPFIGSPPIPIHVD